MNNLTTIALMDRVHIRVNLFNASNVNGSELESSFLLYKWSRGRTEITQHLRDGPGKVAFHLYLQPVYSSSEYCTQLFWVTLKFMGTYSNKC